MSLNIPPAPVSPAQAARELRVIIKGWMTKGKITPPSAAAAGFLTAMDSRKVRLDTLLVELFDVLKEVDEAGKLRKSSLVSERLRKAESIRRNIAVRVGSFNDYYRNRVTQGATVTDQGELGKAYALVQVLPVIEDSPGGKSKAENTLRAMLAILKAHHGLLEHGAEKLPTPDMPIVLLREVEKVVEAQQQDEIEDESDDEEAQVKAENVINALSANITTSASTPNLPF